MATIPRGAKGRGQDMTKRNAKLTVGRFNSPGNTTKASKGLADVAAGVGKAMAKGTYSYNPKKKK